MFGSVVNRLGSSVRRALSQYAVGSQEPELALDFTNNKYRTNNSTVNLSGAITHSRSGNAVMTDGYGPELVVNGGFDSDSDWTKGTGWSIANGVARSDGSQTGDSNLYQLSSELNIGKVYEITYRISDYSAGSFKVFVGSTASSSYRSADGIYTDYILSSGTAGIYLQANANFVGSIDNVSVREMPVLKWAPHNLLQYSEDFSQSVWTDVGGTLTTDSFVDDSSANAHYFFQNIATITATQHTLGLEIKAYDDAQYFQIALGSGDVAGNPFVNFDLLSGTITADANSIGTIVDVGDGWYRCEVSVTSVVTSSFGLIGVAITSSTNHRIPAINTSSVTLNYGIRNAFAYRSDLGGMVDNPDQPPSRASYVPTTSSAVYLPRVGHHVYNGSAWVNEGLLAESESRTNLVVQSHDFNTSWSKVNASVTSDDAVGPDGLESADLLVANTTNSQHRLDLIPTSSAGTQTFSVYLKPNGYSDAWLRIGTSGSGFNLTDGSTFITTGGITTTAQEVGNGWYRCSVTTTNASANDTVRINVLGSSSANDFAGDGTSGIYIYGAQLEAASTPSSLIPTSGSSVTRASESFTIPSANLPWPEPNYIGSELVTNGTFDTDSDWTKGTGWSISGGKANLDTSVAGAGVFTQIHQSISTASGNVYEISADFDTLTNVTDSEIFVRVKDGSILSQAITATGTQRVVFVANSSSTKISVDAGSGHDGNETVVVDNISVREVNPLSVSIAMDGRMTYADENNSNQARLVRHFLDSSNSLEINLNTASTTGVAQFIQEASNVVDFVTHTDEYAAGILSPFNIASRHGSTFINGAADGVALTANTTPTALPDLSATDLDLAYDYMGTIGTFRVWDRDLGDDGIVEATNPSLEPSLSLTFEGTGTNSFVVNNWSE